MKSRIGPSICTEQTSLRQNFGTSLTLNHASIESKFIDLQGAASPCSMLVPEQQIWRFYVLSTDARPKCL
ncbi:hypothetical protein KCV07_g58, partial [Aureobasidium melanogenum]